MTTNELIRDKAISARSPHAIDAHVGERVRLRRTLMGLSQEALGDELNLSFQQVQKYERGTNRISASRLYEISRILDVPISYFFEGVSENEPRIDRDFNVQEYAMVRGTQDPFSKRETLELVRAYYKITDPAVRRRLYQLVKSMSEDIME